MSCSLICFSRKPVGLEVSTLYPVTLSMYIIDISNNTNHKNIYKVVCARNVRQICPSRCLQKFVPHIHILRQKFPSAEILGKIKNMQQLKSTVQHVK